MSLGVSQLLRTTEAAIMIRTELMIPAAASQARFRPARVGAAGVGVRPAAVRGVVSGRPPPRLLSVVPLIVI
jgi:hypothetical protein